MLPAPQVIRRQTTQIPGHTSIYILAKIYLTLPEFVVGLLQITKMNLLRTLPLPTVVTTSTRPHLDLSLPDQQTNPSYMKVLKY